MPTEVSIQDRRIGAGHPCFVIAEAGVNHNGDLELARKLVRAAAEAGADAIKFQTFIADKLASPAAPMAEYQIANIGSPGSQLEMLRGLELPRAWHRELLDEAARSGILFLSTPFDEESADFLETLGVCAFKVGSGDLTNLPLLRHVARKCLPMIVSTGMAGLGDVETALDVIRGQGNDDVILLHCVSNYPAEARDVNLRAMSTMRLAFGVPIGYSDHTQGINVALGSVALGAALVEKHLTLDRALPGPDHIASLEPDALHQMILGFRMIESALGDGRKIPAASEQPTANVARKSIAAARDLTEGSRLTVDDLVMLRPGIGLPPAMLPLIIGRKLRAEVKAGTLLTWEMV